MKNDLWSWLLTALLLLSSLCAAFLAYTFSSYKVRAAQLEREVYQVNQDITRMQTLAAEVSEYSKKNPAVTPILRDISERFRGGGAAANPSR